MGYLKALCVAGKETKVQSTEPLIDFCGIWCTELSDPN